METESRRAGTVSTQKLEVNVTKQDIESGVRCSCDMCPIALRLNKLGFLGTQVALSWVRIAGVRINLPMDARRFVDAYDVHGSSDAAPFSFTLELPTELMNTRQLAA